MAKYVLKQAYRTVGNYRKSYSIGDQVEGVVEGSSLKVRVNPDPTPAQSKLAGYVTFIYIPLNVLTESKVTPMPSPSGSPTSVNTTPSTGGTSQPQEGESTLSHVVATSFLKTTEGKIVALCIIGIVAVYFIKK